MDDPWMPLAFDLTGAAFKADPHPTFAAMRERGEVIEVKLPFVGVVWMTTTHAATSAMVKDAELFVVEGRHAGRRSRVAGLRWWMPRSLKRLSHNMLGFDDPEHRRLRRLVDHAFARRDVQGMRSGIETRANALLDGFGAETDLVSAYARKLPLLVIGDLLGLSEVDSEAFAALSERGLAITSWWQLLRATGSLKAMTRFVARRVDDTEGGLIGALRMAEGNGERLNREETIVMILLLMLAGYETTTHLVSGAVMALEDHPDQKAWLMSDPQARMERAVEEILRSWTPVQLTKPRFVARNTDFFGQPLRRGEIVMPCLAAANADPKVFDAPEELRLDRFPNPHLAFSSGVHFCLGMQLARIEAQLAVQCLYARFPDLAVSGEREWVTRLGIRGVKRLPVRI